MSGHRDRHPAARILRFCRWMANVDVADVRTLVSKARAAATPTASPWAMQGGISRLIFLRGRRSTSSAGRRRASWSTWLRQQRAIGRVVIAAAADAVLEIDAFHHVLLRDDVIAFEQAGLANAGLRREIDDIGVLETGHVLPGEVEKGMPCAVGLRTRRRLGPQP